MLAKWIGLACYGAIISISFVLIQVFIEYLLLVLQSKCNLASYL